MWPVNKGVQERRVRPKLKKNSYSVPKEYNFQFSVLVNRIHHVATKLQAKYMHTGEDVMLQMVALVIYCFNCLQ